MCFAVLQCLLEAKTLNGCDLGVVVRMLTVGQKTQEQTSQLQILDTCISKAV
jgi:hypothetical protein